MSELLYFGYGANRDADMMEAMVGRKPTGSPTILEDYELCVQVWDEIPDGIVKQTLEKSGWDSTFRTYCIKPAAGKTVNGTAWILTRHEFDELVGAWEMHGLWYEPTEVSVADIQGQTYRAKTEIIADPRIRQTVDGTYPTFLNDRAKMLDAASMCRKAYLESSGIGSSF